MPDASSDSSSSDPVDSVWQWLRSAFGVAGNHDSAIHDASGNAVNVDNGTGNHTSATGTGGASVGNLIVAGGSN
ncbi:MAG TPA: hypothetical protein VGH89_00980, partial [Pseudonocardia sp.]